MSVRAVLEINVYVECPDCGKAMDLMDDYNDEGQVIKQACTDGYWIDDHQNFKVIDVACESCGHEFDVKGLDW